MLGIVVIVGLVLGSFMNVLIARYNEVGTIAYTRSHCMSCKKVIAWYDLFPVISFLYLRGRCRYCKKPISWQYPIVELLAALVAVHVYLVFGLSVLSLGLFVVLALLLVLAVIDLRDQIVPDGYMLCAVLLALLVGLSKSPDAIVLGVLLGGGFLGALAFVSKEQWMGYGDIGFGVVLGLLTGLSGAAVGLALAFVVGSLVSVILLLLRKLTSKSHVPFGPFLVLGTYIAVFHGSSIAQTYINFIGY